ncbi:MAG: hypothetical protein SV910_05925 [Chloroflexota bacterium]|nr:hypothetical protein [Chloroflexota bacterium]
MLLDAEAEREFREQMGTSGLGDYQGVIFRLGFNFERLPGFDPARPERYGLDALHGSRVYRGRRGGRELLFAPTLMGAPAASFSIERYLCHSPASHGIGVGYCGALHPDIEVGSIIVPDRARIGEGTSSYYGAGTVSVPDHELVELLVATSRRHGCEPWVGEVFSIDAPLMETQEFIAGLAQQGTLGIDMETSALFSIACYHGVRSAAILVVSDKPHQGLPPVLPFADIDAVTEAAIRIAVEALATLEL